MKRMIFLLVVVLLLAGCVTSDEGTATQVEEAGEDFGFELARDWRALAIMITLLAGMLIALAYMFGQGFDMPELKAWASVELVQIVVTLVIIISFASVLTLLDTSVAMVVNSSDLGFRCDVLENCAIQTATEYLDGLMDMARGETVSVADKALIAARLASYRIGLGSSQAFWPPFLQSYVSFSALTWARYQMELELETQLMQWHGGILSILSSQRFFVSQIAFKMAPVLLLIGAVARSFFVTRRLGGLLMAVGLGVMFVFPAMYVVNWLSLNITLFGDEVILPPGQLSCPAACQINPPEFYLLPDEPIYDEAKLYNEWGLEPDEIDDELARDVRALREGEQESLTVNGKTAYSCNFAAQTSFGPCPTICRTLPLPLGEECTFLNESHDPVIDIKKACYSIPEVCRVIREVETPDPAIEARCPSGCRTTLPLNPSCSEECLEARDYCRVAQKEGVDDPVLMPISLLVDRGELPDECEAAEACAASLEGELSCVYVQPAESMLDQCSGCIFVGEEYTVEPPLYTDCARLCGDQGPGQISPAQFAQATRGQMKGRPEVTGVSALIIPAYILPLLNIVVTLMFIRTFSPILGGDIEIPGMAKLI